MFFVFFGCFSDCFCHFVFFCSHVFNLALSLVVSMVVYIFFGYAAMLFYCLWGLKWTHSMWWTKVWTSQSPCTQQEHEQTFEHLPCIAYSCKYLYRIVPVRFKRSSCLWLVTAWSCKCRNARLSVKLSKTSKTMLTDGGLIWDRISSAVKLSPVHVGKPCVHPD